LSRRSALPRLAAAYAGHQLRRALRRPPSARSSSVEASYAEDRLAALTPAEREGLPAMSRCINCGLCALVVRRAYGRRLPDLTLAYLRDYTLLPLAAGDVGGDEVAADALAAAAAACPVGVPLGEVLSAVRRLAGSYEQPA
jgi:hypothetical protein